MKSLEDKLPICICKLRVMRQAYLSEEDLRHRNCQTPCPDYLPYNNNREINLTHGKIAYELMRK